MSHAGGRPTSYNAEIAKLVCDRVATHTDGLRKLCAKYVDMPDDTTIALWRITHEEFSRQYIDAKRSQIDLIIEDLDDLYDENVSYYIDSEGNKRIDAPSAAIATAKTNNKKWYASKIAPKVYGDHRQLEEKIEENAKLKDELRELQTKLAEANKKEY